jgi:hypothetical protein
MSNISELIKNNTSQQIENTVKTELEKNTVRPDHYGSKSGQDVIDVAEDFGIIDNAYKFNMLKYLLRGGKKAGNSELQDMIKIRVYNDRYIEKLEGKTSNE